jgi:arylsulfatase A-like enzyme
MRRSHELALILVSFLPSTFLGSPQLIGDDGSSLSRPNILFILADDLAWSDLGSYGHPWHETPRIDSLAIEGARFTQAYAPAPICSASRASILTGKTTARLGFEFVVKSKPGEQVIKPSQPLKAPPFTLSLGLDETTIAERLLDEGYETAFFGKWHLNPHYKGVYNGWSPTEGPGQQGFTYAEENFGTHPYSRKELDPVEEKGKFYSDGLTEKAVRFLQRKHSSPFFLMVSHFYVHTPIRSPYLLLREKYNSKVPQGIPYRDKRIEYAVFVETLDQYVGQLLDGLEASGAAEDTMVVFLSDNGGHPEYVSNKPLRGSKWNLYEGGIRVPMLVKWPEKVSPGLVNDNPVIGYDLFPTFLEVGGADTTNENLDGVNLLPLLEGNNQSVDRPLYWHFPYYHPEGNKFGRAINSIGIDDFTVSKTRPQSAIRKGAFKLIYFEEDQRSELYNLVEDLSEQNDLSNDFTKKTRALTESLLNYLTSVDARRAETN